MNHKQRDIKLTVLQINSSDFNKQCEDDFRRIIASFLKTFKNLQSGGVGSGIRCRLWNTRFKF